MEDNIRREHILFTRRYFAGLLATGLLNCAPRRGAETAPAVPEIEYLTTQAMFGTVERGNPLPYKLPPAELAAAGLTPETWKLEILADPEAPAELDRELTIAQGNAFTFEDLTTMGESHGVRFLKTLMCAKGAAPLGTGLWEGVPLHLVLERVGIRKRFRRAWYYGFHNNKPKQMFRSSLSADRIYESPLETPPVVLAYRLNGLPISGKRGGPVRLIVPEAYGFKNVKWLSHVMLSNHPKANDTYMRWNATAESWMKSLARVASFPKKAQEGSVIPVSGIAQVGTAGLTRVQVALVPDDVPYDDTHYKNEEGWTDATILPPPASNWGGELPPDHAPSRKGKYPSLEGFDEESGQPKNWPLRFTTVHWATVLPSPAKGRYQLTCRTIDRNGAPQPWPRRQQNSGKNRLHRVPLEIT